MGHLGSVTPADEITSRPIGEASFRFVEDISNNQLVRACTSMRAWVRACARICKNVRRWSSRVDEHVMQMYVRMMHAHTIRQVMDGLLQKLGAGHDRAIHIL